jgi:hypothetical protein
LKPLVKGDGNDSALAEADAILDTERAAAEQKVLAEKLQKAKEKREYKQKSGKKSIAEEQEVEKNVPGLCVVRPCSRVVVLKQRKISDLTLRAATPRRTFD